MTHDQAACELDWPVGTVRGRLARRGPYCAPRLDRRGLTYSAGLGAVGLRPQGIAEALSASLVEATVQAAVGSAAAGDLTETTAVALQSVLRSMYVAALARSSAPLLLLALVAGTAAMLEYVGEARLSISRTAIDKLKPVPLPAAIVASKPRNRRRGRKNRGRKSREPARRAAQAAPGEIVIGPRSARLVHDRCRDRVRHADR